MDIQHDFELRGKAYQVLNKLESQLWDARYLDVNLIKATQAIIERLKKALEEYDADTLERIVGHYTTSA